jgi:mRNA interferase MazF
MNFGDVIQIDFGVPVGSEAGFMRPAVLVTANAFLRFRPTTVFVVPLTSTVRRFPSHIEVAADPSNGLEQTSCALVEQLRAVAIERCSSPIGNVGAVVGQQILEVLATIVGMP